MRRNDYRFKNSDKEALINEISDLFYHVSVLMAQKDITPEDIAAELIKRSGKTGNLKQFTQAIRTHENQVACSYIRHTVLASAAILLLVGDGRVKQPHIP